MMGQKLILKWVTVGLVAPMLMATGVAASERTQAFLDGLKYYNEANFSAAIQAFAAIADDGVRNGKLFYNLGNAHLKNGDLGHAILWYERARKLIPNDPDLKFNLDYALSLLKDEKADEANPVLHVLIFWQDLLGAKQIEWAAVILNGLCWVLLTLRIILKHKKLQIPGRVILVVALAFTLTAFYNYYSSAHLQEAVILSPEVSVRSGLAEDSTELFVLHAGTKVKIEKAQQDFFRIYFSKGKIGWLRKSEAAVI